LIDQKAKRFFIQLLQPRSWPGRPVQLHKSCTKRHPPSLVFQNSHCRWAIRPYLSQKRFEESVEFEKGN